MILQTIGAFLAVMSFGFLLDIPGKFLVPAGAVGGIGWLVYLFIEAASGSVIMAAFVSSLVIGLLSQVAARVYKAPVTLFLVSGILPSVPGASIYRSVYFMMKDSTSLANYYLVETLQVAGAIAVAIFIVDSVVRLVHRNKR